MNKGTTTIKATTGALTNGGTITNNGTIENNNTITQNGTVTASEVTGLPLGTWNGNSPSDAAAWTASLGATTATAFGTAYDTVVTVKDQYDHAMATTPVIATKNLTLSNTAAATAATISMANTGAVTLSVAGTTTAFEAGDTLTYEWTLADSGLTYKFTATVDTPKTTPAAGADTDTTATLSLTLVEE